MAAPATALLTSGRPARLAPACILHRVLENRARVRIAVSTRLVELGDVLAQQRVLGLRRDPALHSGEDIGAQPLARRVGRKVALVGGVAACGRGRDAKRRAGDLQNGDHSLRKHGGLSRL
jgi:hypothetical protein